MLCVFSLPCWSCMSVPSLTLELVMLILRHAAQLPSQLHRLPSSFRPAELDGVCCFHQAIYYRHRSPFLSLFNS